MDKISLDFKNPESSIFNFQGKNIEVRTFLTLEEQAELINSYLAMYFFSPEPPINYVAYNYFGAEYALKALVIDKVTNIEAIDEDKNITLDMGLAVSTGLWGDVMSRINGYETFRKLLDRAVSDMKDQIATAQSVGSVIDRLSDKLGTALDSLMSMNISPENLSELKETVETVVKKMEDSPIAEVFKQGEQEAKKKRSRKKSNVQ